MQDDSAAVRVLDHDTLGPAEVGSLGGALRPDGAGGEGGEGLEVGLRRGRGDERGEGGVGEVQRDGGMLRGEVGHDGGIMYFLLVVFSFSTDPSVGEVFGLDVLIRCMPAIVVGSWNADLVLVSSIKRLLPCRSAGAARRN